MNDKTPITNIKITGLYLVKGNYEGYDYFKMIAETDKGIAFNKKLTQFEYDTLKAQNVGKN